jgi:hypothetical protein
MANHELMNSGAPLSLKPGDGERVVLSKLYSAPVATDGTDYIQIVVTYPDTSTRTFLFGAADICHLAFPRGASIVITVVGIGSAYIVWALE